MHHDIYLAGSCSIENRTLMNLNVTNKKRGE